MDKPTRWKADTAASVDLYNDWFMTFAPKAFRDQRVFSTKSVVDALHLTNNLADISPAKLASHPQVLSMLRMATCPPIARDRLTGLAGVSDTLVGAMEDELRTPPRMRASQVASELAKVGAIIQRLADPDIFVWLGRATPPTDIEVQRAASIVADRLCGSQANPIIRNAQEHRQLALIGKWLADRGYTKVSESTKYNAMAAGTFAFHVNVPVKSEKGDKTYNVSIDVAVKRKNSGIKDLPVLIEAKSAGDFTNTNKRRKEEAKKIAQLVETLGEVDYILFLCGYFDAGYLGYEAQDGIDWVWEHRPDDLALFNI